MVPTARNLKRDIGLSSKLHSFSSLSKINFPSKIILDTNYVLNFTHRFTKFPANENVSDCREFCKSLVYDSSKIFIPQIVINEFCCQVFLNVISEYQKKHNIKRGKLDIYGEKPQVIVPGHKQIKEAVQNLDIIIDQKHLREDGSEIRNKALKLMRKYDMLPSDAYIGAIAIMNQVFSIATLDVYFAKCISQESNVNVFLPENLYSKHFK